jgi:hypothetical protein
LHDDVADEAARHSGSGLLYDRQVSGRPGAQQHCNVIATQVGYRYVHAAIAIEVAGGNR